MIVALRGLRPAGRARSPVPDRRVGGLREAAGSRAVVPIGKHCILELYGCPTGPLDDVAFVEAAVRDAAAAGNLTLLHAVSHRFTPHGVTGLALLAESHLSVHTWPEVGYVAADLFSCGDRARPERACELLVTRFRAARHALRLLTRGEELGPNAAPSRDGSAGSERP